MGNLVRTCEQRGCDLTDLTLDDLRAASSLFEADAVGLRPEAAVAARDVPGGTAPARVAVAIEEARAGRREILWRLIVRLLAEP